MRSLLCTAAAIAVIGLAYWAYNENYATHASLKAVERLQLEIGDAQERLGVLRAEWAYLNRPDRLRELADLNYPSLKLIPLAPEQFGTTASVIFPHVDLADVKNPVDLSADLPNPLGGPSQ